MTTVFDDGIVKLIHGDAIEALRDMADASVDAVVTDPPYGLSFMGKDWDHGVPGIPFWQEMLRVAKPGAHLLAFGGTRTVHRIATAIEDAGWEIRDMLVWGYASGFPKSLDVSKAIDKAAGAEREVVGRGKGRTGSAAQPHGGSLHSDDNYQWPGEFDKTAPATDEAKKWQGFGTALKPAWEPIVMARKPLIGTVVANVLEHGTGALNIEGTRIPVGEGEGDPSAERKAHGYSEAAKKALGATVAAESTTGFSGEVVGMDSSKGRWPANVILTEPIFDGDYPDEVVGGGSSQSGDSDGFVGPYKAGVYGKYANNLINAETVYADAGGKSRFFLIPKADRAERERGLEDSPKGMVAGRNRADGRQWDIPGSTLANNKPPRANTHPTVKPVDLMRHLVRLVTPPDGIVLDPFVGSGTTMLAASEEGLRGIGIDQDEDYLRIAEGRLVATPIGLGLSA